MRELCPFDVYLSPCHLVQATNTLLPPGGVRGQLGVAAKLPPFHLLDVRAGEAVRGDQPDPDPPGLPALADVNAEQVFPDRNFAGLVSTQHVRQWQ